MTPTAASSRAKTYLHVSVGNWGLLQSLLLSLGGWVFRGQARASWALSTTLERSFSKLDWPAAAASTAEARIIRLFRRQAHHFTRQVPAAESLLEWAALVRHFGGPSRLLDFTRSPFVAAFFALESAPRDEASAIWAVEEFAVNHQAALLLARAAGKKRAGSGAERIVEDDFGESLCEVAFSHGREGNRWVACGEPFRQNERLAGQQGVFLTPYDVSAPFEANLFESFGVSPRQRLIADATPLRWARRAKFPDHPFRPAVMKISIEPNVRQQALPELKLMNITAASLLPGLDGFARSLRARLESGSL